MQISKFNRFSASAEHRRKVGSSYDVMKYGDGNFFITKALPWGAWAESPGYPGVHRFAASAA
jgi:hypothetical protein